jgi:molybdopterin/thiamine biosynthesis adenylyltransferase/ubiquitin-protein ligase
MMPWFLRDPERFNLERRGIEELSRSANWLVGTEWRLGKDGLGLDAVIRAKGHDYEVLVSFPTLYPDAPIIVSPQKMESRISTHQYGGADGPLCLEWGPDNWHRDITAVQMLESTHRLFEIENPLGEARPDIPMVAPSRHTLTMGQELRRKLMRWYESRALSDYFANQLKNSAGIFKFSLRKAGIIWISLVSEATAFAGNAWRDDQIPTDLPGTGTDLIGIWFKTELEKSTIGHPDKLADIRDLLAGRDEATFLATDGTSPVDGFGRLISGVLIVDQAGELHLFIVFPDEEVFGCSRVRSEDVPIQTRSPEWDELNSKTIGIVGLGSVGSKITMSLARMGCRKFYLIDHDLLLPENLQRHALDWQGVVQHKVDAMKASIGLVAPGAQIDVSRLHITGQESSASISGALDRLASCDVLIDATSNARVFNLLAAVARTASRPMIWMEVFGGGMGGLIARSRPGTDPTPQDMRGAYLQYCTDNPAPSLGLDPGNYAIDTEEGHVLVASDADIAIIAHHAARLVPDCFTPPERSNFPYSMYLIGLTKGWIFEAPFDTRPISMESYSVEGWGNDKKQELTPADVEFLLDLLKKDVNATTNTP